MMLMRGWRGLPLKESVYHRQQNKRQQSRTQQPSNHHNRQRPLYLRAWPGCEQERNQAQRGHRRRHHHRAEPQSRSFKNRRVLPHPVFAELADVRHQHHAVQHCDAPECDEADRGRDGEVLSGEIKPDNAADRSQR